MRTRLAEMDERVEENHCQARPSEQVWLLEHPPLYTAGNQCRRQRPGRARPVSGLPHRTRRPAHLSRPRPAGGLRHAGPGKRRQQDVRAFVSALEAWLINTLWNTIFAASGAKTASASGCSVRNAAQTVEDKIAAIGIRLRKWVTFHGISFNVEPDLEHFSGIVPCGITDHGVTSLVDLGIPVTMAENDSVLRAEFEKIFGPTVAR